ncbi:hypothetical protein PBY51_016460 [Eleginops maclovinus]|uniref:Uncharacterized protein n=1 Tax=Eleginops maclovinus TaxID=56733 RepID=A0AAN7XSW5_ELEMC|nr:hypothetical protein PBY51_016460 [Eleginops maclovinus]
MFNIFPFPQLLQPSVWKQKQHPDIDPQGLSVPPRSPAVSVLRPELQCFISDYQLTRDAALHRGPQG